MIYEEYGLVAVGPSVWVLANPVQFCNQASSASGGVSEEGLLAVALSVWVLANPAQFGNLDS